MSTTVEATTPATAEAKSDQWATHIAGPVAAVVGVQHEL